MAKLLLTSLLALCAVLFFLGDKVSAGECGVDCACKACLGSGEGCVCDVGPMVVNEVHLDARGNLRWVELVNVGETRTLAGVALQLGGKEVLRVRQGTVVKAGQALVVYNRYNAGEARCNAANPTLRERTGAVFVSATWQQMDTPAVGLTLSLVDTTTHDDSSSSFSVLASYVIKEWAMQTLEPDVFGVPVSALSCSPGSRYSSSSSSSSPSPFVRLSINEVMIDAGLHDFNRDNVTGELSTLPAHGMQDAYIEIVNKECYNVDISGFTICVTCPAVCEPVFDDGNNLLGCPPLQTPACTPFHLFPAPTVLPPGGAALVFAGYAGPRGGDGAGVTFSMAESADFGYSVVQIASFPSAVMESYSVQLDHESRRLGVYNPEALGLQKLLPILPCLVCQPGDPLCSSESTQPLLLVGANPLISYSVMNGAVPQATADLSVLDIKSGISFAHIPDQSGALFSLSCASSDECGCDPTCATPGYNVEGDVFVQPKVVGLKTVSDACLSPGDYVTVTTVLSNVGDQNALDVTFSDAPFEHSELVVGSVTVTTSSCSEASVVTGNTAGDTAVYVVASQICICSSNDVIVQYQVRVTPSFDCDSSLVTTTQGEITWAYGPAPNSSVTTSSATYTPLDAPTVVTFCGLSTLDMTSNDFFGSTAVPGQTVTGVASVQNTGRFPACGVSLSLSSSVLSCTADPENPVTVDALSLAELAFFCTVPQPFPCVDDVTSVDVAVIVSNNDASRPSNVGFLGVQVFDNVTSLLTASCSDATETGCCPPGATVSFSGWIQNSGNRDACDVSYQLDGISDYGQVVLGSVVADYCNIHIGNNYGDDNGPVFLVCPKIEGGGVEYIDFDVMLWSPAPTISPAVVETNAKLEYTSDGTLYKHAQTTSDVGINNQPTSVCLTARPELTLTKSCLILPSSHSWIPSSSIQYLLTLVNNGTQDVDVNVTDLVVASQIFVSTDNSQCSFDVESSSVVCTFYSVPPNTPVVIEYIADLNPEGPSEVEETSATAVGYFGNDDVITVTSDNTECGEFIQQSVVTVATTLSAATVSSGDVIDVTVTVSNSLADGSNEPISSFTLSDTPNGCSIVGELSLTPEIGWVLETKSDSELVIQGPALLGGQSATLSYSCRVQQTFAWDAVAVTDQTVVTYGNSSVTRAYASAKIVANTDLVVTLTSYVTTAEAGSVVHYTARIVNFGTRDAHNVLLADVISPQDPLIAPPEYLCNTSYMITISTADASSTSCDYAALLGTGLLVGDVPAIVGCMDVDFYLQVACPIAADAFTASNLVYASYLDINAEIVSWCQERRSTSEDSSVEIAITGDSFVTVTKSYDVSAAPPGGDITFTIEVLNSGNRNLFNAQFDDIITDPYLSLVLGSIVTDGQVLAGNKYDDKPNVLSVYLGVVEGTSCGGLSNARKFSFVGRVADAPNAPPGNVTTVCNQGTLSYITFSARSSNATTFILSDDPSTLPIDDATCVPIDHYPQFILSVSSTPHSLTAGDTVTFTVLIENDGIVVGSNLLYTATFDPNLLLIPGTVTVPKGVQNVQNVIISGNRIEDTHVQVAIGTLGLADSFVLSFQATVANPFDPQSYFSSPEGLRSTSVGFAVSMLSVVGTASINYTSLEVVEQLVDVSPAIFVTKSADLAASSGLVPGQNVQYTISVSNLGNAIGNVVISDYPYGGQSCVGSSITFLPGTVDTSRGVVTYGNYVGQDSHIEVNVGTLAPFETATILFEAVVTDPFPCETLEVINQASYFESYTNQSGDSDDPSTPPIGDPTATVVFASPFVSAFKSVAVKGAASMSKESHVASPGDTLVYSVSIHNDGNQAAFAVNVTDTLDPSLTLVLPIYLNGNALDSRSVLDLDTGRYATEETRSFRAMIGTVDGANTSVVKFSAIVSVGLSSSSISNQAVVTGTNFDAVATSSAGGSALDLPTSIDVDAVPDLDVTVTWTSASDPVTPGSVVWYTISVANLASSSASASNVKVSDIFDGTLSTLNLGSVTTSAGTVVEGNTFGDENVVVSVGTIGVGETVNVQFSVTLASFFPANVNSVTNVAQVSGSNFNTTSSHDPNAKTVDQPTVVPVEASPDIQIAITASANGLPVSSSNLIQVGGKYTTKVSVKNAGNQEATAVVVTANIDLDSTFIAGSVVTTSGVVSAGNYVGDSGPVVVSIPSLGLSSLTASISFTSSVNSPFAGETAEVAASVSVASSNFVTVPFSTSFPVNAATQISVSSTCDFCVSTGTKCDSLNPGDKIQVSAVIVNSGNQNAFDVVFLTNPAAPMVAVGQPFNVVPASAELTLSYSAYANGSLQVNFPQLAGGQSVTFSYYLQMTNTAGGNGISQEISVWNNDGASAYTSTYSCASAASRQGISSRRAIAGKTESYVPLVRRGDQCPPVFTACRSGGFAPNLVDACGMAKATLKSDNDHNSIVSTGDILLFNISLYLQSSCSDLPSVTFTDIPDPINAKLVSGSVRPTFGRVVSGNQQNDGIVLIDMGKVAGNRQTSSFITFEVEIIGRVLGGKEQLTNSGYLTVEYYGNFDLLPLYPQVFFAESSSSSSLGFSLFAVLSSLFAWAFMML